MNHPLLTAKETGPARVLTQWPVHIIETNLARMHFLRLSQCSADTAPLAKTHKSR
jgi:hypothetical protein